jgi:hypothetical protein
MLPPFLGLRHREIKPARLAPLECTPLQLPHRTKAAIGGRTLDMRSGELGLVPLMKQKASKNLYPLIVALSCFLR